jgi:type I restriction enzyme, S subunit
MTASSWPQVRLKDIGTWFGGGTPSKSNRGFWTDGTVSWLSPKDMGPEVLVGTQDHITQGAVEKSPVKRVPGGSVALVVRSGILERTLPVALVPFDTTLNQDMKAVVPRPDIDARWIAWGLRAHEHELLRTCRKAGTTVASMEMPRLYEHTIPVPHLDEQRRIVDILEDHLSRLDAAKMLTQQSKLRLATWRRAVVDSAFWHLDLIPEPEGDELIENLMRSRESRWSQSPSGKQNKAPVAADLETLGEDQPWPVVSLESATDPRRTIRYGILKPAIGQGGTVRYVEVRDLAGNTLTDKTFRLTSRQLDEQFSASRLAGGDVVIAVRGSYERTAVVPKDLNGANLSRDVARLASLPELLPELLHYWLQTSSSKGYLNRHARGVAVKGVNISTLRAMPVPLLPLEMQRRIVDTVNTQLAAGDRATLEIDRAARLSETLRRSLLAAAFSGRLTGGSTDMEIVKEMAGV